MASDATSETGELNRACPLCGGVERTALPHYSLDRWEVVRCMSCSFVYLHNTPVYDLLKSELAWEKTFESHAKRVKKTYPMLTFLDQKTRWRLHLSRPSEDELYRKLFPAGCVLDVGCGSSARAPTPFTPYGIEISEALAARADEAMRPRGGHCARAPAVEGMTGFADGYFSGVLMRSFLEHEAQPMALLEQAARVLRPGGVAFVKVPNYGGLNRRVMGARWCGFRYPDHVNYFSLETLAAMTRQAGFSMRLLNWANHPLDDNLHAALTLAS